ncbi:hypothetical protein ON010_g14527 [Phytophthora cinnamomi]|nr:hypothetical protein ON010_g14527 [Phytophthora cinnamomi]
MDYMWTLAGLEPSRSGQTLVTSMNFSASAAPPVKKDVAWVCDEPQRQVFNAIKLEIQHAPVLHLPGFAKAFIVTTDATIGRVLSQLHNDNDLSVAFFSNNLGPHELNWFVHEKELLTRWRHYLHGVSLKSSRTTLCASGFLQRPRLFGRLARWPDFFASLQLHHRPGTPNVFADALSRPSSPGEDKDDKTPQPRSVSMCTRCLASPTCTDDQPVMFADKVPGSEMNGVDTAQWCMKLQLDTQTKREFQNACDKDPGCGSQGTNRARTKLSAS